MKDSDIHVHLEEQLEPHGLEVYPFQVAWYNELVKPGFSLNYEGDTLAFTVISTPSFFEKAFIPFIQENYSRESVGDYLDKCISSYLNKAVQDLDVRYEILHDFEMRTGTRRAKVLVQTAGHVSGAAYFYQRHDVKSPPWPSEKAMYGVAVHPEYSGWFALRGVIVFPDVKVPNLERRPPIDVFQGDQAKIIELLERFNNCWQDWSFRDVFEPRERYSDLQRRYFATKPADRREILQSILNADPPT